MFVTSAEDYLGANSYLSIEEAGDCFGVVTGEPEKQEVLKLASLVVDGVYQYKGEKTGGDVQGLKFPRSGSEVVPNAVKGAVKEMVSRLVEDSDLKEVTAETIGKMSWQYAAGETSFGIPKTVLIILKPLKMRSVRLL